VTSSGELHEERGLRGGFKQQVPHPPREGGGFGMTFVFFWLAKINRTAGCSPAWNGGVIGNDIASVFGAGNAKRRCAVW
jgi:hypothetical protein